MGQSKNNGRIKKRSKIPVLSTQGEPTHKITVLEFKVDPKIKKVRKVFSDTTSLQSQERDELGMMVQELNELVGVLAEAQQNSTPLTPQSLAPVLARAIEVFGNSEKATRWMERPNRALSQKTPVQMLSTPAGRKEVEELLGRIEYGVYS